MGRFSIGIVVAIDHLLPTRHGRGIRIPQREGMTREDKGVFFAMQQKGRHVTPTRRFGDIVERVNIKLGPLKNILAYPLYNIPSHKPWHELGNALGGNFLNQHLQRGKWRVADNTLNEWISRGVQDGRHRTHTSPPESDRTHFFFLL